MSFSIRPLGTGRPRWLFPGPRGEGSALHWICAQLCELPLRRRLYAGKSQSEFLRVAPANRGPFNGNRVNVILQKDPTLELRSDWDEAGTHDTTTPGGEVS